jgi:chromosome segregation ATPase
MDDKQAFDVESIVHHIRENLRKRRMASAPYSPDVSPEDGQTAAALADLHSNHDIYRLHLTSHRKVCGWLVVLAKKLVRQLLTPSLERQVAYNAANMQISSRLWERLQETRTQLRETRERQGQLRGEIEALAYQQGQLRGEIEALAYQQGQLRGEIEAVGQRQEGALQALQAALQGKVEALAYQQGQLRGEIEAVGQRQEGALQALQAAIVAQVDDWGQQHAQSLQAWRDAIIAQMQLVGQHLADQDRRLMELERALTELRSTHSNQERQPSMLLEQGKKAAPVPMNRAQF